MFIPWTAEFDSNALSSERPFQILPMGINFVLCSTTLSAHNLETAPKGFFIKKKNYLSYIYSVNTILDSYREESIFSVSVLQQNPAVKCAWWELNVFALHCMTGYIL